MKNLKNIITIILITFTVAVTQAQGILVTLKNGEEQTIEYKNYTISGKGIETDNGEILEYRKVASISTKDFKAYEKASKRSEKNGSKHIKVEFTGDRSAHLEKLQKLENRRNGAHVARGAGGLLAIIGAISGDRDLYNAGMVTYGVGTIAKDINTDKTIATQNQMLNDLHQNQNKQETEEEQYRREYGNENVDAVIALLDNDHNRAMALASAGETSKDANYRLSAMYVKAIIAVDMNNEEEAKKAYEKVVTFDPEVENVKEAKKEVKILVEELNNLRSSNS